MADYYPLIAKAVSGLEKSTADQRHALYDRARQALIAQLRGVTPALSESDITRERLALEEAIRKVEAEAARKSRSDPPPPRVERRPEPPPQQARQEPRAEAAPVSSRRQDRPATPAPEELAEPEAKPEPRRESRPSPMEFRSPRPGRPAAPLSAAAVKAPPRPADDEPEDEDTHGEPPPAAAGGSARVERTRWSPGGGSSISTNGLKGFRDVVADAESLGAATSQTAKNVRAAFQAAPEPEMERAEARVEPRLPRRGEARADARGEVRIEPRTEPRSEPRGGRRGEQRVEPEPDLPRSRRPSPRDVERFIDREPDEEPEERFEPRAPRGGKRARAAEPVVEPPRSRRQPPRAPLDEPDDEPVDAADFADHGNYDGTLEAEVRAPSSMVRQEDIRARTPPPRAAKADRKGLPEKWPEKQDNAKKGQWKKYASLALAGILVLAVAGVAVWKGPGLVSSFRSVPTSQRLTDAQPAPTADANNNRKFGGRVGADAGNTYTPQSSTGSALVAQKVVLYEEDENNPAGKRFEGTAAWRTEMSAPSPGQPAEMVVRAEVEIPDLKTTLRWSLRRNTDKQLPASHTVEVMFTLPSDFAHGGISSIPGILMKQAEGTRGIPLAGQAVKVTSTYFLIGLSSVENDMARNVQLLKEREWFDIPVVYNDGKRAIVAIEKGTPGDRAFSDAFASWKQ